jgi:hypothetical protein
MIISSEYVQAKVQFGDASNSLHDGSNQDAECQTGYQSVYPIQNAVGILELHEESLVSFHPLKHPIPDPGSR